MKFIKKIHTEMTLKVFQRIIDELEEKLIIKLTAIITAPANAFLQNL